MIKLFSSKIIISHRGIHDNQKIFENTLEAIKLAQEKNYIIEIDIHLTKDNKIIVFHDYNTKRITNQDMIIEKSNYQDLNNQNIIHIPTLEEVLEQVKGTVPLLIEIKQPNKVGKLEQELLKLLTNYKGEYAIQSFNPYVLLWLKKHHPNIIRGQLSYSYNNKKINKLTKIILKNMLLNKLTTPHFISYKYNELPISKIKKYQKHNIKVLGWTITKKEEYEKYIKNYDNLICEKFI